MPYNYTNLYPYPTVSNNASVADQRLTVSSTAVSFATAFNASTNMVLVNVQTADVFVTYDGSDPTTTNGHKLVAGYEEFWSKARASAAKFIRSATTDASVHASEFQL
jgi:mevalonate kinase